MRSVTASAAPVESPQNEQPAKGSEGDESETPDVGDLKIQTSPPEDEAATTPASSSAPPAKGRVLFLYTCPSGSPIKFRMVYSSSVRGIQQEAVDRAGVQIAGKASSPTHQTRPP